jgi:phosphodiesterase/alkaline phosphatase D-like protein
MAKRSTKLNTAGFSLRIVCGPFVRYVSHNSAVIWIEMNRACEVTVIISRLRRPERRINAKTFRVGLRFYAMVPIERLLSSTWYEYQIDAQTTDSAITTVWPIRSPSGPLPYSTFQTFPVGQGTNLRIAYLSCRAVQTEKEDKEIRKITQADALKVYALRIIADYHHRQLRWPHILVMMGDQIYTDDLSPYMRELISDSHKAQGLPDEISEVVSTFEEHAMLYNESWSDEDVRWLLSCIPSLMIFDDHEVIDDWNTSKEWLKKKQSTNWWFSKLEADLTSYWIYQGAGNLSPSEWRSDERMMALIPPTYSHNRDVTSKLHSLFSRYATGTKKIRWSYVRDI